MLANAPSPIIPPGPNGGNPRRIRQGVGFAELGRSIGAKWKVLDRRSIAFYADLANKDKFRYRAEMEEYRRLRHQQAMNSEKQDSTISSPATLSVHASRAPKSIADLATPAHHNPQQHVPEAVVRSGPTIAELAAKLDKESIDIIISTFL